PRLRALLLSAHPARPCLLSPPRSPPLTALPSFPTRRSSDLDQGLPVPTVLPGFRSPLPHARGGRPPPRRAEKTSKVIAPPRKPRSEEHTSELQSRFDLVCRLLLEKKKTRRGQGGDAGERATV